MLLDIGRSFGALFIIAANRVCLIRSFPLAADGAARGRAVQHHIRTTLGALWEMPGMPQEPGEVIVTGDGLEEMDLESLAASLPLVLRPVNLRETLNFFTKTSSHPPGTLPAWTARSPLPWRRTRAWSA